MTYLDTLKKIRTKREMIPTTVDVALFDELIEHLRYAPNAKNNQIVRYAFINDEELVKKVFENTNLPSIHKITEDQMPSAFIVLGTTQPRLTDLLLGMDMGIAVQIAAEFFNEKGYNIICINSLNRPAVKEIVGVEEFEPENLIAIGKSNQVVHIEDSEDEVGYTRSKNNEHTVRKLVPSKLVVAKK